MKLKLQGEVYDLTKYEGVIKTAVADPVNRLTEGLRGMMEFVDLILMVGGHPERYADELRAQFPKIPVVSTDSSVFANVRGYQLAGEELAVRPEPQAA